MHTEEEIVHHVLDTGDYGLPFWFEGKATEPELTNLEAVATLPEGLDSIMW